MKYILEFISKRIMKPTEFLFDDDLSKTIQEVQVPQKEKIEAQKERIVAIREEKVQVGEDIVKLTELLAAKRKEFEELKSLKKKEELELKKLEEKEQLELAEKEQFYTWKQIETFYVFIGLLDKRANEPVTVIHLRHKITRQDFAVKVIPILDDYTNTGLRDTVHDELHGAQLANELRIEFANKGIGAGGLLAQTYGFILSRELPEKVQIRLIENTRFYAYIFMEYIPYGFNDIEYGGDTIKPMEFFIEIMYAILYARRISKFSHNDLHLGNIRIKDNVNPRTYGYTNRLGTNMAITIRSKYQPCIVDFGRSVLNETSSGKSDVDTFVASFREYVKRPGKKHEDDVFILDDCAYNFIEKLYSEWRGSGKKGVKDTSADSGVVAEIINSWYALKDTICAKCDLKIATGMCERCMFVKYCSRICQLEDYEKHKTNCV